MNCPARLSRPEINLEDYLYMVEAISNNFNSERVGNIRDSEIFGYLSQELVSCSYRFDPSRGSFDKYLSSHLFNRAIDFLRSSKRKKRLSIEAEDLSELPEKQIENPISTEILPILLSTLPTDTPKDVKDRSILVEHYLGGRTVAELSKRHKTTRVTIYNALKRSLCRIRENHNLGGLT